MASLGDVLNEIFAPRAAPEGVPSGAITDNYPTNPRQQGAGLLDHLKRMFAPAEQPPDGMDERTYRPSQKRLFEGVPTPPPMQQPDAPQPQQERPWATATPDSNEGYAQTFGAISGNNDPARAPLLVPSSARGPGPGTGPGAAPAAAPVMATPAPMRRAPVQVGVEETKPTPQANTELARVFRAFLQGAGSVDPTAPGASAFFKGASGAVTSGYNERQKETLLDRQRDKEAFDRALRTTKNAREDVLANNLMDYRNRKSSIDAAGIRYQDIKSLNEAVDRNNTNYQRALQDINKRAERAEITPEQAKEERTRLDAARAARESEIRAQYSQRTFTPKTEKGEEKKAQPQKGGDGSSKDKPLMTNDPTAIQKLPSGSYFVNPADGLVYQKN